MTPKNIMNIVVSHSQYINGWTENIIAHSFKELTEIGIYSPRCFALSYSYTHDKYDTLSASISEHGLSTPEGIEETCGILRNIDKNVYFTFICLIFISEGKYVDKKGKEFNFIMVSFEDKIRGWKDIYTFDKTAHVLKNSKSKLTISNLKRNKRQSRNKNIPSLERLAHIIHPDYSDTHNILYN